MKQQLHFLRVGLPNQKKSRVKYYFKKLPLLKQIRFIIRCEGFTVVDELFLMLTGISFHIEQHLFT